MNTRLKQGLAIGIGVAGALVMIWLGLWQMQVFTEEGNRGVEERARQAPVQLASVLTPEGIDGDAYGKPVIVHGTYLDGRQILIPTGESFRILDALRLDDGRVLPVVRGLAPSSAIVPAPTGQVQHTGLLLPGEGDAEGAAPGQLRSVRMPLLVQLWDDPLVPGFVTLSAADSAAQGLAQAPVQLPEGQGSFQNGGYALQWWVFAAFALWMAVRIAHTIGHRDALAREASALAELSPTDDERTEQP